MRKAGINLWAITESPIAIIDLETTGLTPGIGRIVEVSVSRLDPRQPPRLVLDTLVNPMRSVAATEIHGIKNEDVVNAPQFSEIAGELIDTLSGCVLAGYNVYFDIKFLTYELANMGIKNVPPYICLMYMRPMLELGDRCSLEETCRSYMVDYRTQHVAAYDAEASSRILQYYLEIMKQRGISKYSDLAQLKKYKFTESFDNDPLPGSSYFNLSKCERLCSRIEGLRRLPEDSSRYSLGVYWDALTTVLSDLEVTDEELEYMINERRRLGLQKEQIRVLHARAFTNAIAEFVCHFSGY
jgi:DNA polymerase-3 subunit epsilon